MTFALGAWAAGGRLVAGRTDRGAGEVDAVVLGPDGLADLP